MTWQRSKEATWRQQCTNHLNAAINHYDGGRGNGAPLQRAQHTNRHPQSLPVVLLGSMQTGPPSQKNQMAQHARL
eukprot:2095906-Rhodomonas_salina.2